MPGTLVHDANAANLATGATLTAAATVTGTAVQLAKSGLVQFELLVGTVTTGSDDGTLSVEIKGGDDSAMSGSDVVSYGRFALLDDTDANLSALGAHYLVARVDKEYVQATIVIGGTTPDFSELAITPVMLNLERNAATTTA